MSPSSRLRALLPTALDVVAPLLVYYVATRVFGVGDVLALILGGLVGGVGVGLEALRRRRLDRLGVLVLVMFAVTLALLAVTGDPRLVLAKPAVSTAVAGLYCLATLAGRPLVYDTAQPFAVGGDPARLAGWESAWDGEPRVRRALRGITALWGIVLLAESALRIVLTYTLPLDTSVWASQVPGAVGLVLAAAVTGLTLRFRVRPLILRARRIPA